mgnify:CR=1 FL=1
MFNLRFLKIRQRVFAIFFVVLTLSATIIFQSYKIITQNVIKDYLFRYINISQSEIERNLKLQIDQVNMFASRLLTNSDIYILLNDKKSSCDSKEQGLKNIIDNQVINKNIIGYIYIIGKDGNVYFYGDKQNIEPPDKKYVESLRSSVPQWGSIKKDDDGNAYILNGRKFYNFYTGQSIGYMVIYIKESSLFNMYNSMIKDWGYSFLVEHDRYIISYPDKSIIGDRIFDKDTFDFSQNEYYKILKYNGNNTIITMYDMGDDLKSLGIDWKMYSIISDGVLFKNIRRINIFAAVFQAIIIIFSLFLAYLLSRNIIDPLSRLNKKLRTFGKNSADVSLFKLGNKDELWVIEKSFNDMVTRINDLIEQNKEAMERQRETELTALQAQINPHFIYNTLDTIGWMAKVQNQFDIESLVIALATFFRLCLHKGEKFITVNEEIKLVASYLNIQQVRFPGKFDVSYDVSDDIKNIKILKLILQPLVENAITHGLSEKRGKGHIQIRGYRTGDDITFEVYDDGIGFDPKMADNVAKSYRGGGYGIKNVDERIKLEYGNSYGINIYSKIGSGTKAIVKIKSSSPT